MTRARATFALQIAFGALGAAVVALAVVVIVGSVSLSAPPAQRMLEACGSFVLPRPTLASVALLALGSLAFAVLILGWRSARRQLRASRRFLAALDVVEDRERRIGDALLFEDERAQAFCAGLLRPRVFVSTAAVRSLAPGELQAVLAHEAHHARYRDPFRVFVARVLGDALFFLPGMRRLAARYAALAELAADDAAVRASGDRQPLAAALLAFDRGPDPAVVGIAPERVDHLLGDRPRWELPGALLVWSLVVLAAVAAVALRVSDAMASAPMNLPLIAAQACMLLMAIAPLAIGAAALVGSRRLVRRTRG